MARLGFVCILLCLLVAAVKSDCPSPCLNGGSCEGYVCVCKDGFTGDDCSYELVSLKPGVTVSKDLPQLGWMYFLIPKQNDSKSDVVVVQTPKTAAQLSQCDLYYRPGDFPTRRVFTQRVSTVAANHTVTVSNATAADHYFGVFAFLPCSFNIVFSAKSTSCPDDCHKQGACQMGVCVCDMGFAGPSCGTAVTVLKSDTQVTNTLKKNDMAFYQFQLAAAAKELSFQVRKRATRALEAKASCMLFVNYGSIASDKNFNFKQTEGDNYTLAIADPVPGSYYATVVAYSDCSYALTVAVKTAGCASKCSNHGMCNDVSVCTCNSGYDGKQCQNKKAAIGLGKVSGYAADNTWNYYHTIKFNSKNTLILELHQTSADHDCDLYVQKDKRPELNDFRFSNTEIKTDPTLTIPEVGDSVWYISVYGAKECEYDLTLKLSTDNCPKNCGHGKCQDQICVCDSGWIGDDCSNSIVKLDNTVVATGTVMFNSWQYFTYTASANTSRVIVVVKEVSSKAKLWLYATRYGTPTLSNSEVNDHLTLGSDLSIHSLEILKDPSKAETYNIGVYGSLLSLLSSDGTAFKIQVWESPL